MIVDEVEIYCKAGSGGQGCRSALRLSSRKTTGGGGDGGSGGDVVVKVSPHFYDLSKFHKGQKFVAGNGKRGGDNNKKGRDGTPLVIEVPAGTLVKDLHADLLVD